MTLIVAADVQDHLILAGDHCAVLSRVSNQGLPDLVLDNYRKVHPWKYGGIVASGDVFMMAYFHRLLLRHDATGQPLDVLRIARQAKAARSLNGIPPDRSTGNIFFTLPTSDGFRLQSLCIERDTISLEIIEPISTHFSLRKEAVLDEGAYQSINGRLRPSCFFEDIDAFNRYHIELLSTLYAKQSAADKFVTSSFDVFMLDKRTGAGSFWQTPSTTDRTFVSVALASESSSNGTQVPTTSGGNGIPLFQ